MGEPEEEVGGAAPPSGRTAARNLNRRRASEPPTVSAGLRDWKGSGPGPRRSTGQLGAKHPATVTQPVIAGPVPSRRDVSPSAHALLRPSQVRPGPRRRGQLGKDAVRSPSKSLGRSTGPFTVTVPCPVSRPGGRGGRGCTHTVCTHTVCRRADWHRPPTRSWDQGPVARALIPASPWPWRAPQDPALPVPQARARPAAGPIKFRGNASPPGADTEARAGHAESGKQEKTRTGRPSESLGPQGPFRAPL